VPTYEYECSKCGKRFDLFQSMSDEHIKECKYCQGPVKRLIGSGGGIIFKGSGFYETDYKRKDEKKEETPPPCPSKDGGCKGCPKADGK